MRVQLALNVRDMDEAVEYYSKLFGAKPHKRRDGYANFAIDTPPLKLVLFENPGARERLHHLGVEVSEAGEISRAFTRLEGAGIVSDVERQETCCYATQDKIWSREPQGLRWEWYRILDDDPALEHQTAGTPCCSGGEPRKDWAGVEEKTGHE